MVRCFRMSYPSVNQAWENVEEIAVSVLAHTRSRRSPL